MTLTDYRTKHKADVFRERLQSLLKRYNPEEYSIFVANKINYIYENRKDMVRYPIHFLLHSIQANALYHHRHRNEPIDTKALNKIMRHYTQYYDPIAEIYLSDTDGVVPFFINMSRQQFYLQQSYGIDSLGRSLLLFDSKYLKKTESFLKEKYNLTFYQWYCIGFAIYAGLDNLEQKIIDKSYLLSMCGEHIREENIDSFFEIVSTTSEGVKEIQNDIFKKVGEIQGLFYDTYLQGSFFSKPFLKLKDGGYLAVHKELFMRKVIEGIFDLCKKEIPSDFGVEFGKSFESYVGEVIRNFIPNSKIITETDVRKITDRKVCDYILVLDDCIYLIECKGVEYSAHIAAENAMKNDNSTKKISTGYEQLTSAAKMLKEGLLVDLVGNIDSKKIIASVITYKQLYQANTQWYFDKIISPNIANKDIDLELFDIRPQVVSIMELEKIMLYLSENNFEIVKLFREKVDKNDFITGDWIVYLKNNEASIQFLNDAFEKFIKDFVQRVFSEEIDIEVT
ncbi:hypothetical protein [Paenibacillus sp. 8b26]|uniref:hypothetical protein n=1 Tax=Paenibacillus sp. 8b26 TaxID=3424133 RepID=UPI003D6588FF